MGKKRSKRKHKATQDLAKATVKKRVAFDNIHRAALHYTELRKQNEERLDNDDAARIINDAAEQFQKERRKKQ